MTTTDTAPSREPGREFEDPLLDGLDEQLRAEEELLAPMGAGDLENDERPEQPYDLKIRDPRAFDFRKLCELTGQPFPAELDATVGGPRTPLLLSHAMVPYARDFARRPRGAWVLGYTIQLGAPGASTISLVPTTEEVEWGRLDQQLSLGLDLSGAVSVPQSVLGPINAIPGIALHEARLGVKAGLGMSLALEMRLSFIKSQAVVLPDGGAHWKLYRSGRQIELPQAFIHTLLVPKHWQELEVRIEAWLGRRARFFGQKRSMKWEQPPQVFRTPITGGLPHEGIHALH